MQPAKISGVGVHANGALHASRRTVGHAQIVLALIALRLTSTPPPDFFLGPEVPVMRACVALRHIPETLLALTRLGFEFPTQNSVSSTGLWRAKRRHTHSAGTAVQGAPKEAHRVVLAQERPLQTSRIVFGVTPYLGAIDLQCNMLPLRSCPPFPTDNDCMRTFSSRHHVPRHSVRAGGRGCCAAGSSALPGTGRSL